jgi:hypothetical protein
VHAQKEFVERTDEVVALLSRKRIAIGTFAPRRQILVDLEVQRFSDFDKGVLIGRMQPAAAEIEGDLRRGHDGVAAPADAVARLQHDKRDAGLFQRMRGAEARSTRADDRNVD